MHYASIGDFNKLFAWPRGLSFSSAKINNIIGNKTVRSEAASFMDGNTASPGRSVHCATRVDVTLDVLISF